MPIRLGDRNESVRTWRKIMNARFGGLYTRLHGPLPTDTNEFGPRAEAWQKEYEARTNQTVDGVVSDHDLTVLGIVVPPLPSSGQVCVGITIGGAGSAYNNGYQWDLGEALDKGRCYHQPIGFNTNPFPMNTGVKEGVQRTVDQLFIPRPLFGGRNLSEIPWFVPLAYSMGSIVWMTVLMRVLHGDLQQFKRTFMGSNSFGNPMRQKDHGLPGGILVEGEGIAWTPDVHDVPEAHWDFTAEKDMPGSPGNDLYAKVDGSELTVKDMRAVWNIVNKGNPASLAIAVLDLLATPTFNEGYAAAVAAFKALDFFIIKGLTPHTSYHLTKPIPDDGRDCWRIALDRSNDIVARLPQVYPNG